MNPNNPNRPRQNLPPNQNIPQNPRQGQPMNPRPPQNVQRPMPPRQPVQRPAPTQQRPAQHTQQYIPQSRYPAVRHRTRRQSQRAAFLTVLAVIILAMLMISLLIFAARCATGQLGGDEFDDTTPVVPGIVTTDPALDTTTAPIETEPETTALAATYEYAEKTAEDVHRGYLILVNYQHEFSFDAGFNIKSIYAHKNKCYKVRDTLVTFDYTGIQWMNKMFEAFEAETGKHDILINSSVRTLEEQQEIYDFRVDQYGEEYAELFVSKPGYSEHHTGLACDLTIFNDKGEASTFTKNPEYSDWMTANAHKYGFILRYPADKTDITKIGYEDWHYRYVGRPHAYYMMKNNLCLEEYIELLKSHPFDKPLVIDDDEGTTWQVYYIPEDASGTTQVPVPKYMSYNVSGNNVDGFIVTMR